MTTKTMNKKILIGESPGCRDLSALTIIILLVWVCLFLSGCGEEAAQKAPVARPVKMLTIGSMGAGGDGPKPGSELGRGVRASYKETADVDLETLQ